MLVEILTAVLISYALTGVIGYAIFKIYGKKIISKIIDIFLSEIQKMDMPKDMQKVHKRSKGGNKRSSKGKSKKESKA